MKKKKNVELPNWEGDKTPTLWFHRVTYQVCSLLSFTSSSPGIPFAISAPLGSIWHIWKNRTGKDLFLCLEWQKSWWPHNTPQKIKQACKTFFFLWISSPLGYLWQLNNWLKLVTHEQEQTKDVFRQEPAKQWPQGPHREHDLERDSFMNLMLPLFTQVFIKCLQKKPPL